MAFYDYDAALTARRAMTYAVAAFFCGNLQPGRFCGTVPPYSHVVPLGAMAGNPRAKSCGTGLVSMHDYTRHTLRTHSLTRRARWTRQRGSCRSLALMRIGASAQVACNPYAQRGRWRRAATQQCRQEPCERADLQFPQDASRGTGASCMSN